MIDLIPIIFVLAFVMIWVFACKAIAGMGGLVRNPDLSGLGPYVGNLGNASGRIGLVWVKRAMSIRLYADGFTLRMWRLFGGYEIPVQFAAITDCQVRSSWLSYSLRITTRDNQEIDIGAW